MNSKNLQTIDSKFKSFPTNNAYLLGRKITCITTDSLIRMIHKSCENNEKITVANYNVHSFNMSIQFPWFYKFLQQADIAHCDGLGIIYALRFMGYSIPHAYRVSYSVLMPKLLRHCNNNCFSVYLLGAKDENLKMALNNIKKQYPNIKIFGHHGYFFVNDKEKNLEIVSDINKIQPNVLIVGMGMPIQEYWVQKYQKQLNVNSILLGGAVIDRLAGIVPECPEILSNIGLEWLFRLVREPKRLMTRYILGNPAFLLQITLAKFQNSPLRISAREDISSEFESLF
ncbi:WecB/TagA/CpsF family glycosyltransferase [Altericista sp. CCNU0014]|uniref:WecB/TagA/CpsF family glycosyltransferase n=1 Tax=Altericista sp. CCNU0014 TaxID=3082949 RepID=UPI00384C6BF3